MNKPHYTIAISGGGSRIVDRVRRTIKRNKLWASSSELAAVKRYRALCSALMQVVLKTPAAPENYTVELVVPTLLMWLQLRFGMFTPVHPRVSPLYFDALQRLGAFGRYTVRWAPFGAVVTAGEEQSDGQLSHS